MNNADFGAYTTKEFGSFGSIRVLSNANKGMSGFADTAKEFFASNKTQVMVVGGVLALFVLIAKQKKGTFNPLALFGKK